MNNRVVGVDIAMLVVDDVSTNGSSQGRQTPDFGMMGLSAGDPIMARVGDQEGLIYTNPPNVFTSLYRRFTGITMPQLK